MKEIIIGLICTMCANVLLGATLSKFKEEFNWEAFFKGLFKVICVVLGMGLIYLCGYLNPEILAINIGGVDMNLIEALKTIFVAGIVYYGYQDLNKVIKVLKISVNASEVDKSLNDYLEEQENEIKEVPEVKEEEDEITISR